MNRILLALALLGLVCASPLAHASEAGVAAADRAKVPSFRLKDLKGKKVNIKNLKGKGKNFDGAHCDCQKAAVVPLADWLPPRGCRGF